MLTLYIYSETYKSWAKEVRKSLIIRLNETFINGFNQLNFVIKFNVCLSAPDIWTSLISSKVAFSTHETIYLNYYVMTNLSINLWSSILSMIFYLNICLHAIFSKPYSKLFSPFLPIYHVREVRVVLSQLEGGGFPHHLKVRKSIPSLRLVQTYNL